MMKNLGFAICEYFVVYKEYDPRYGFTHNFDNLIERHYETLLDYLEGIHYCLFSIIHATWSPFSLYVYSEGNEDGFSEWYEEVRHSLYPDGETLPHTTEYRYYLIQKLIERYKQGELI